jgi:hypothetical protein
VTNLSNLPNVTVQVLPTSVPYLPGMDGSFVAFELVPPYGQAVAVHDLTDPVIHEQRGAERYADVFEQLSKAALDEAASADVIVEAAEGSDNREGADGAD